MLGKICHPIAEQNLREAITHFLPFIREAKRVTRPERVNFSGGPIWSKSTRRRRSSWYVTGSTTFEILRLACPSCNHYKSDRLISTLESGSECRLFDPQKDSWNDHFGWSIDDTVIVGISDVADATITTLRDRYASITHQRLRVFILPNAITSPRNQRSPEEVSVCHPFVHSSCSTTAKAASRRSALPRVHSTPAAIMADIAVDFLSILREAISSVIKRCLL